MQKPRLYKIAQTPMGDPTNPGNKNAGEQFMQNLANGSPSATPGVPTTDPEARKRQDANGVRPFSWGQFGRGLKKGFSEGMQPLFLTFLDDPDSRKQFDLHYLTQNYNKWLNHRANPNTPADYDQRAVDTYLGFFGQKHWWDLSRDPNLSAEKRAQYAGRLNTFWQRHALPMSRYVQERMAAKDPGFAHLQGEQTDQLRAARAKAITQLAIQEQQNQFMRMFPNDPNGQALNTYLDEDYIRNMSGSQGLGYGTGRALQGLSWLMPGGVVRGAVHVPKVARGIYGAAKAALPAAGKAVRAIGPGIKAAGKAAGKGLKYVWNNPADAVKAAGKASAGGVWNGIKGLGKGIWAGIKGAPSAITVPAVVQGGTYITDTADKMRLDDMYNLAQLREAISKAPEGAQREAAQLRYDIALNRAVNHFGLNKLKRGGIYKGLTAALLPFAVNMPSQWRPVVYNAYGQSDMDLKNSGALNDFYRVWAENTGEHGKLPNVLARNEYLSRSPLSNVINALIGASRNPVVDILAGNAANAGLGLYKNMPQETVNMVFNQGGSTK